MLEPTIDLWTSAIAKHMEHITTVDSEDHQYQTSAKIAKKMDNSQNIMRALHNALSVASNTHKNSPEL